MAKKFVDVEEVKPKVIVPLPVVTEAKALGNKVVFEELGQAEILGTSIELLGSDQKIPHEAIILDIGPMIDRAKYGFNVGDRVVVNGICAEMPKSTWKNGRKVNAADPGIIVAKLL